MITLKKTYPLDHISDPIRRCQEYLNLWLHDQDLSISKNKQEKLSLLLARYFSERENFEQKDVTSFLANLGGGHFDADNLESVEIEIQRLLGYTEYSEKERARRFTEITTILGLLSAFLIAISIFTLSYAISNI